MVDISVKSWLCQAEGHHLSDVLQPVYVSDEDGCDEDLSQLETEEINRSLLINTSRQNSMSVFQAKTGCFSS